MIPRGRLLAIDRSWNMLITARANLRPDFGNRVAFVRVELPHLPFDGWADLVFSTATFHWVRDHETLVRGHLSRAAHRRPSVCAVRRRSESRRGARARRRRDAPRALRAVFPDMGWRLGIRDARRHRAPPAGGRVRRRRRQPRAGADDARRRGLVSRIRHDGDLQPSSRPSARRRAPCAIHRRGHRARRATGSPFTLDYWRLNLEGRKP